MAIEAGRVGTDQVLGRSDLLTNNAEVKGQAIRARRRYVLEKFGEPGLQALAKSLDPPSLDYLNSTVLPSSWYQLGPLYQLDRAIVGTLMKGDRSQMRQLGRDVAQYDLTTLYKLFFRIGSPSFILGRVAVAFSQYTRPGKMDSEAGSDHERTVEMSGVVVAGYMCAEVYSGWMEAAVTMSGGKSPHAQHSACQHRGDRSCIWKVSWS